MKLWIDLSNAPHVLFFRRLIKELNEQGHELLITARKYGYLVDLIKKEGIDAKIIGKHAGKDNYEKLRAYTERVAKLAKIARNFQPDGFLCKYSVDGMRTAAGLAIPSVLVVDNDQSAVQNALTIPLATKCLMPECVKQKLFPDPRNLEPSGSRLAQSPIARPGHCPDPRTPELISFSGVSEVSNILGFTPDKTVLDNLGLQEGKILTIRTGPLDAGYFHEKTQLEKYLTQLSREYDIIAFPRNNDDKKLYEKCGARVSKNGIDVHSLVYYSEAFLGEGGTMTREAALLGTPTVSCYPQALLEVDRLLINKGLMKHSQDPALIAGIISTSSKQSSRKIAGKVMEEFEDPLVKVRRALGI